MFDNEKQCLLSSHYMFVFQKKFKLFRTFCLKTKSRNAKLGRISNDSPPTPQNDTQHIIQLEKQIINHIF